MKTVDLRSDTVTVPGPEMRRAIADAEVGDDVYGEDPTVNALEEHAAGLLGKEDAVYCPSGTQSNLLAILSHCQRGDEYIVGQAAHTYRYEGGGAAVLGSVQPQPLEFTQPGVMPLDGLVAAIKPDDSHFARTRLVCLENTHSGSCLPEGYADEVRQVCDQHGLGLHLDGARLFNAAVQTGTAAEVLGAPFDTVSVCLSKGLGAPLGSVLCGSRELVACARRWRKVLGGGMRQAGMMAAAGLYALHHNIDRLAEDHAHAGQLRAGLEDIDGLGIGEHSAETNMVFVEVPESSVETLASVATERNIVLPQGHSLRLVTHLDVSRDDIDRVLELFRAVYR